MDKNLIELGYVLDRSGSMSGRVKDVIGGFNGLMEKQQKEPGRANVTIVAFDSDVKGPVHEVLADGTDIRMIRPLDERTYFARGGTPLFDAVAKTIDLIGNRLRNTPEEKRPGKVLITVMTDGDENESKEFGIHNSGAARLRDTIKHQQEKYLWDVVFLGANMDAVLAGGEIGLSAGKAMTWSASAAGVGGAYSVVSSYTSRSRSAPSAAYALVSNNFSSVERSTAMGNDPADVAGTIPVSTILGAAPPLPVGAIAVDPTLNPATPSSEP